MAFEEWRCSSCKRVRKYGDRPLKETLQEKYKQGHCHKCRAMRFFERVPMEVWEAAPAATGEQLRDEGMTVALENAQQGTDAAWIQEAQRAADILIVQRREFTIVDITDRVGLPTSRNTVGAFMGSLSRSGRIGLVGYRRGTRESQHARRVAVWRAV